MARINLRIQLSYSRIRYSVLEGDKNIFSMICKIGNLQVFSEKIQKGENCQLILLSKQGTQLTYGTYLIQMNVDNFSQTQLFQIVK